MCKLFVAGFGILWRGAPCCSLYLLGFPEHFCFLGCIADVSALAVMRFTRSLTTIRRLDGDPGNARVAWQMTLEEWRALEAMEREAACGSMGATMVLRSITWLEQPLARLYHHLVERESQLGMDPVESRQVAEALNFHFGDEKGPEDMHCHVRDLARAKRSKTASLRTIHGACLNSGVLEGRRQRSVNVDLQTIANKAGLVCHF